MCDSIRTEKPFFYTLRCNKQDVQIKPIKDKLTGENVYLYVYERLQKKQLINDKSQRLSRGNLVGEREQGEKPSMGRINRFIQRRQMNF